MAVITEPGASKAATLTGDMLHMSFPIEKAEDTEAVNPVDGTPDVEIWGKATDGTLDSDLQIVDPGWSLDALKTWFSTKANVRMQHDPKRPVGKGIKVDGHYVRARISDPLAKHFIRTGVLNDFSVGIINPDVRKGDPQFRHLKDWDKAVNGVITGRPDGLSGFGELSVVDRGSNYGTAFSLAKAATDGTLELTGTLTAPEDLLAKASASVLTKECKQGGTKGVTLTLPKDMSLSVKPSDLAKLATFKQRLVQDRNAPAGQPEPALVKSAEPDAVKGDPGLAPISGGTYATKAPVSIPAGEDAGLAVIKAAEAAVYKRDIDTATRRRLAAAGQALADGSYPIENTGDLANAAILARSKHGNWKAARKLIARMAAHFKVPNPLKGGKAKVAVPASAKTTQPQVTKCTCDNGMVGGKPCPDCKAGKRAAKRMAAAKATAPAVAKKKGKLRAVCPGCGAKQNPEHAHCPECGAKLPARALTVAKNHDFVCLGCGKELDKGEKFCPGCGKENPGHNPMADQKIPANKSAATAAGKDRVTKGRKNSGKPRGNTPAGASGAVSAPEKPVGPHREPDGAEVEALERDSGMTDVDSEQPAHLEAHTLKPAPGRAGKSAKPKPVKKPKGKKGAKKLPPWLKDKDGDGGDGAMKAAVPGLADPELQAAYRLKSLGVPLHMGIAHDLTCPAFMPAETDLCYPGHTLKGLDLGEWREDVLSKAAGASLEDAQSTVALLDATVILRSADPADIRDLREHAHAAFKNANPGPGSFPSPVQLSPQRFNRPYLTEGHAAPSPGQDPPNHARIPATGGIQPEDYRRGYLEAGRADDSPANTHPSPPMPAPDRTGTPISGPAMSMARDSLREGAAHAMEVLHNHVAGTFAAICPMHPHFADHPVPVPQGHPPVNPVPGAGNVGAKKAALSKADRKAARARKAAKLAKARARKARQKAQAKRDRLGRQVLKGTLDLHDAQAKLGMGAPVPEGTKTVDGAPGDPVAVPVTEDALAAAVKSATAPLMKRIGQQDKRLRRQSKILDAIAGQPDTTGAPFRGVALPKTSSPAGTATVTKSAEQTMAEQQYARLYHEWATTTDPAAQEALTRALIPYWNPAMAVQQMQPPS